MPAMQQSNESDPRWSSASAGDLQPVRRWLETAAQTIFPLECAVVAQRYDSPDFAPNPADVAAVSGAVGKRQREFAAGRAAARGALGKLGVPASFIAIGPDRNPLWPTGLTGSISHTAGLALAVVARREHIAALGIDLELSSAVKADLWRGILTTTEIDWIRGQPSDRQGDWATLIFCAKECFFKLQHPLTGAWVDFRDAEVLIAPDRNEFNLTCSKPAATDRLRQTQFGGRYANAHGFTLAAMHLPATQGQGEGAPS